jgi:hypothetical protein
VRGNPIGRNQGCHCESRGIILLEGMMSVIASVAGQSRKEKGGLFPFLSPYILKSEYHNQNESSLVKFNLLIAQS